MTLDRVYFKQNVEATYSYRTWVRTGGVSSTSSDYDTKTNTVSGYRLDNYRKRIALGLPATTTMQGEEYSCKLQQGALGGEWFINSNHTEANRRIDYHYGNLPWSVTYPGTPSGLDPSAAQAEAAAKVWKRLVQARNAMSGGTFLGELRETIATVKNCGKRADSLLFGWLERLKRNKRRTKRLQDRRKDAADAYLEWSFGMAPVMSDVKSALNVWTEPRRDQRRVHGDGKSETSTVLLGSETQYSTGPFYSSTSDKTTAYVSVRIGAALRAQVPGIGGVVDRLGLLPEDFYPTVYNLLPWSFLLDYVSNVGDCIDALSFPTNQIAYVWRTTRKETRLQRTTSFRRSSSVIPDSDVVVTMTTPCVMTTIRKQVSRVALDFIPCPSIRFNIPGKMGQWMNIAALTAARKYQYWP